MESKGKVIRINLMLLIVIVVLISTIVSTVINIIDKEETTISEYSTDYIETIDLSETFSDNGWIKDYISDIRDDVAIPKGYEYVQGEKDTGLIIKDLQENYYMWIPYNKNAKIEDIDEYYKNVKDKGSTKNEVNRSIDKYGGFYISLINEKNDYSHLKKINEEDYKNFKEELEKEVSNTDVISVNLISKFQLEQVLYFTKQNNTSLIKINNNSNYKITKLSNTGKEFSTGLTGLTTGTWYEGNPDIEKMNGYAKYTFTDINDSSKTHIAYVPDGFKHDFDDGYLKIQNINNHNLQYVWVSMEYLDTNSEEEIEKQTRKKLEEFYNSFGLEYALEDMYFTLNEDIKKSLKEFKGFYVAESETKLDGEGNICTYKTATVEFNPDMPNGGDYIRLDKDENILNFMVKANKTAEEVQNYVGDNLISTVMPVVLYETIYINVFKDNPNFVVNCVQENAGIGNDNKRLVAYNDIPTNIGIDGLFGRLSELTGDQNLSKDRYDIKESIDENGNKSYICTAINFLTDGTVMKGGSTTTDFGDPNNMTHKEETIGFRLALFVSPANIHAQYFDIEQTYADKSARIRLDNAMNVPENLVIPKYIMDETGNQYKVKYAVCTGNTQIKTVVDEVTNAIPPYAYAGCSHLTSITTRMGIIGNNAFENCSALVEIKDYGIQSSNLTDVFGYNEGDVFEIGKNAFKNCSLLKDFVAGEVKVESVELIEPLNKIIYKKGESLDLSGGKLKIKYNDATEEIINLDWENPDLIINGLDSYEKIEFDKSDLVAKGILYKSVPITIKYKPLENVNINITVYVMSETSFTEFSWDSNNIKKEYMQGEEINIDDVKITYDTEAFSNKRTIEIGKSDWKNLIEIEGYNKDLAGKQNVTLKLGDETCQFEVMVKQREENKQQQTNEQFTEEKTMKGQPMEGPMINGQQVGNEEEQTEINIERLQNYQNVYENAFDGCISLERFIIGNVNEFVDENANLNSETSEEENETNNPIQNNNTQEFITKFMQKLPKIQLVKIGDKVCSKQNNNTQQGTSTSGNNKGGNLGGTSDVPPPTGTTTEHQPGPHAKQ